MNAGPPSRASALRAKLAECELEKVRLLAVIGSPEISAQQRRQAIDCHAELALRIAGIITELQSLQRKQVASERLPRSLLKARRSEN
jgi:hypothetical protein